MMSLNPKKSPILFSLLCGWTTLVCVSFLPIWKGYPGWHRIFPRHVALWEAMPFKLKFRSWNGQSLLPIHFHNLGLAFLVLVSAGVVGRFIYWLAWERTRQENGLP
jgi:hypothetical protein